MAQRALGRDPVAVAPPVALPAHVAQLLELGHDPVRRALGDPHPRSDVAQSDLRVRRDALQHEGMVREEYAGLVFHHYEDTTCGLWGRMLPEITYLKSLANLGRQARSQ